MGQSVGGQWGRRDRETARQGGSESSYFAVAAPHPRSTYLRHSWPLGRPATSGGPAFRLSPLLFCTLQHLSLQLSPFPVIPYFFNSSSSFIFFWVSVAKMPSNSRKGASSRWGKLGKKWVVMRVNESPPHPPPPTAHPFPAPNMQLPRKVHSATHRPRSLATSPHPGSPRRGVCHSGAAYTLWHHHTLTEEKTDLQRARFYWFVWEFTRRHSLSVSASLTRTLVCRSIKMCTNPCVCVCLSTVACFLNTKPYLAMRETEISSSTGSQPGALSRSIISIFPLHHVFLFIIDDNHTKAFLGCSKSVRTLLLWCSPAQK